VEFKASENQWKISVGHNAKFKVSVKRYQLWAVDLKQSHLNLCLTRKLLFIEKLKRLWLRQLCLNSFSGIIFKATVRLYNFFYEFLASAQEIWLRSTLANSIHSFLGKPKRQLHISQYLIWRKYVCNEPAYSMITRIYHFVSSKRSKLNSVPHFSFLSQETHILPSPNPWSTCNSFISSFSLENTIKYENTFPRVIQPVISFH